MVKATSQPETVDKFVEVNIVFILTGLLKHCLK